MFGGCSSLISLPDLSKWEFKLQPFTDNIFEGCLSLIYLPDLSKKANEKKKQRIFMNSCNSF